MAALDRLAVPVGDQLDLDAVVQLARAAPAANQPDPPPARPAGRCRFAVAAGPAFSFAYPDNLELLAEAGAELVRFDPLRDHALPDGIGGLVAGGGFPEVFAPALARTDRCWPTSGLGYTPGWLHGRKAAACCGSGAGSTAIGCAAPPTPSTPRRR